MNDAKKHQELLETSWQRPLTSEEEAMMADWAAEHPAKSDEWILERNLSLGLRQLSDAPVPSNFTARLLQSVHRDESQIAEPAGSGWWSWVISGHWLVRSALAGLVLAVGLLTFSQARLQQRQELAASLTTVSAVAAVPGPDVFADFEVIRAMSPTPAADEELLTLLQ